MFFHTIFVLKRNPVFGKEGVLCLFTLFVVLKRKFLFANKEEIHVYEQEVLLEFDFLWKKELLIFFKSRCGFQFLGTQICFDISLIICIFKKFQFFCFLDQP